MKKVIIINNPEKWDFNIQDVEVISPDEYIKSEKYAKLKNCRIFNLCYDYSYQKRGYYVSLLAEAREQKVIPSVTNILDLKSQPIIRAVSDETDQLIQKSFKHIKNKEFILSIYFGKNISPQYNKLSKLLYKQFQAPLLRTTLIFNGKKWEISSVKTIAFKDVPEHHLDYVYSFAKEYFSQTRYSKAKIDKYKYELAILVNPKEASSPSNPEAITNFINAAEKLACRVELITKDDYARINEFDALFIRETTSVNHYTYKMARRAQRERLAVLDSPESILRCANKVYLAELLEHAKIPTPKTAIIQKNNVADIEKKIGYPCVLKIPDSSFSQGVMKVNNASEMKEKIKMLFKVSDLLIAQEFVPTDYDWRIGILNNEVLFVCKYYMAKDHWQIYNWQSSIEDDVTGNFDIVANEDTPSFILETALKATKLVGNGLYGVDLKVINGKAVIIEINDNPNIDAGVEDSILKDTLYTKVIEYLINQLQR